VQSNQRDVEEANHTPIGAPDHCVSALGALCFHKLVQGSGRSASKLASRFKKGADDRIAITKHKAPFNVEVLISVVTQVWFVVRRVSLLQVRL